MDQSEQMNIVLVVDDEESLYNRFNPEAVLSEAVKAYIRSKFVGKTGRQNIGLTVWSSCTLNEEKFRSAVSSWVRDEKEIFRQKEKELLRTLLALLFVGSALIILSLRLEKQFEVLQYSLIPVLGSFSLGRCAGILVMELPTARRNKNLSGEMEGKSFITFEYDPGL